MTKPASTSHRAGRILLCLALAGVNSAAFAASAAPTTSSSAPSARKIRVIEGVTEYELANGLQVLLYPDDSSSTATVNITYKVGSRHESYGETGMAHLLEHLNFKGTPKNTNIPAQISSHGASANATTSYDRTNYFETFPSTDANVEWALRLEADRMIHSNIAQKDLDSEMTVVRNEFERDENDSGGILEERVLETAYIWHNYGKPTIGARADIENVPIGRLQAFYRTYYQPDNATLILAGKFDEAKSLALIEQAYGAIPRPARKLPSVYTAEPAQDGEREVVLRRTGGEQILKVAYHITSDAHPDSAALSLLGSIFGDKPSGRLYKRLVETKLATSVDVEISTLYDPGWLMITVEVKKDGDLAAVRAELGKVVDSLATVPFTAGELERAKAQQIASYERLLTSSSQVAMALTENVSVGDWRLLFWDRDQMKKVTREDMQRVAGKYLLASNRTTGEFISEEKPTRVAVTVAPNVATLLADYKGDPAIEPGEHFDPTPANIEARAHKGTIGNIKTAFLEKKSRGGRVSAMLSFHFGSASALQHKGMVGGYTAAILLRGTQKHNRQQLQDELSRLKAKMDVGGDASGVYVSLETTRENLSQVLALAAEVLQQPTMPADQLDEMKRAQLARLDSERTDPEARAQLALQRDLSPYGPDDFRYVETFDESAAEIGKLTVADLQAFHHAFYGAGAGEIAVVGSFDSAAVAAQLKSLFGSWASASPYERAASAFKGSQAKSERIVTPDKTNAVYMAGANLALRDDSPEYPALTVGNRILGGGFLNSRLSTRIRQKDGLSYSVGSQLQADPLDPVGSFSVYAISAPQNVGKVESDVKEEIGRTLASEFTADEISEAKSGILQSRMVRRSTDGALASELANHLYLNRSFDWDARFESSVSAANGTDIQRAMKKYIDPAKIEIVTAGDFH